MKSPKEAKHKIKKKTSKKIERSPGYVTGRPTTYNKKIADEVCSVIAQSKMGIRRLCDQYSHWPVASTIMLWRLTNEEFSEQYDKAKKCQVELLFDDTLDISHDESRDLLCDPLGKETGNPTAVARDNLKVKTINNFIGKIAPKIYGDAKKEIVFEKQNLVDMDLNDRINQLESLSLEDQRELFGIVAKKIKESKNNK